MITKGRSGGAKRHSDDQPRAAGTKKKPPAGATCQATRATQGAKKGKGEERLTFCGDGLSRVFRVSFCARRRRRRVS